MICSNNKLSDFEEKRISSKGMLLPKVSHQFFFHSKKDVNAFLASFPILYSLKPPENQSFLVFSGGIKWEHWSGMD